MICVECGTPVHQVFKIFGKGGGTIRLTRCKSCHDIADKYVEFEFVLIFIDLILHKIQVYRHLIFNRLEFSETWIPRRLWKFLFVLLLLETYKSLLLDPSSDARAVEKYSAFKEEGFSLNMLRHDMNLMLFHFMMFLVSIGDFLVYTLTIILVVTMQLNMNNRCGEMTKYNYVFVAIIVSTFGRGVLLFMLVWDYPLLFIRGVDVFVLTSNAVALKAFLDTSWTSVICAIGPAYCAKLLFHDAIRTQVLLRLPPLLAMAHGGGGGGADGGVA